MRSTADFSDQQRSQVISNLEAQYRSESVKPSVRAIVLNRLGQALQSIMASIAGSSEPQIRQLHDRDGNRRWRSYDPVTGQVTYFSSEAEVRSWIEQRYYR